MLKSLLIVLFSTLIFSEVFWTDTLISFSSQYSETICSAKQALGKPQVRIEYGSTACAWRPYEEMSLSGEFIELGFKDPVIKPQLISIHQTLDPGIISEIILYNSDKTKFDTVFKAVRFQPSYENSEIFKYYFSEIPVFSVSSVRINLATSRTSNFNEIEAVALLTTDEETNPEIKTSGEDFLSNPKNLGVEVNSDSDELAPIINSKGDKLYFVRDNHVGNLGYQKKQDIWVASLKENGFFGDVKNIGPPLNNEDNNFAFSLTPDENSILLGNIYSSNKSQESGISISYRKGDSWSFPEQIKVRDFQKYGSQSNYFLANDGKTMLLAFQSKSSLGGSDLHVSFYDEYNDEWSKPENIGQNINTAGNEFSPFLAADGKTLYFSSDSYPGFGMFDLFYTKRLDDTWKNWSEPINLGEKINSEGWDAYFTIPASSDFAYYVSTENSIGLLDIFKIELPESLKPEKVVYLQGIVRNSKDSEPLEAKIYYERLSSGELLGIARSNSETGEFKIVLPEGEKYGIRAETQGFLPINENIDLRDLENYSEVEQDLALVPIEMGQKIRLNNIFFDFAKYELLPNSYSELNRIVKFLNDYPEINIVIEGHTDDIGTNERNQKLSEKRARSVMNYFLNKGIDKSRLTSVGYGKKRPIAEGDSEKARRLNRRVEFTIAK